jgi:hypothetical protein
MMDQHPVYCPDMPMTYPTRHRSKDSTRYNQKKGSQTVGAVDIVALVRSLQRSAGLEDCFRMGKTDCTVLDCAWRNHCLGKSPAWESQRSFSDSK